MLISSVHSHGGTFHSLTPVPTWLAKKGQQTKPEISWLTYCAYFGYDHAPNLIMNFEHQVL
jgi:hypothetical protein